MTNIRSFKELRVWQNGMDAAMRVFELTKRFPADERYSLTEQVRKSSRSVVANIAEAWRKRRYPAAFVSKLNDAEGEAAESQTWTEIALRCKYLSASEASELDGSYERILAQLVRMIEHPEDWIVGANRRTAVAACRRGGVPQSPPPRVPASPSLRVPASPVSPRPRVSESPSLRVPVSPRPCVSVSSSRTKSGHSQCEGFHE